MSPAEYNAAEIQKTRSEQTNWQERETIQSIQFRQKRPLAYMAEMMARGRGLTLESGVDRRTVREIPTSGQLLMGLFKTFELDQNLKFKRGESSMLPDLSRYIKRSEIARIGCGRPCGMPYTIDQVKYGLRQLEQYGYIIRRKVMCRDTGQKTSMLFLKLNIHKIIQVMDQIDADAESKALNKGARKQAKNDPTFVAKPTSKSAKKASKNTAEAWCNDAPLIDTIKRERFSPGVSEGASEVLVDEAEEVLDRPRREEVAPPAAKLEFFPNKETCFPLNVGSDSFRQITQLIADHFPDTWTFGHNGQVARWVSAHNLHSRMTVENLTDYFSRRGCCASNDGWQWTCDLTAFLAFWPAIHKNMLKEDITLRIMDADVDARSTVDYPYERFADETVRLVRQIADPEHGSFCPHLGINLLKIKGYVAYRALGWPIPEDRIEPDILRQTMLKHPDAAVHAMDCCPDIKAYAGIQPYDERAMLNTILHSCANTVHLLAIARSNGVPIGI